jgi:hypothetical protein
VFKSYGRYRANVLIEGKPYCIGVDYGREALTREQFAALVMVKEDPKVRLSGYAPQIQAAIKAGKLMVGMNREQVMMSVGYPRRDRTPSLEGAEWYFFVSDEDEFAVTFGADGKVTRIDGVPRVQRKITFAAS